MHIRKKKYLFFGSRTSVAKKEWQLSSTMISQCFQIEHETQLLWCKLCIYLREGQLSFPFQPLEKNIVTTEPLANHQSWDIVTFSWNNKIYKKIRLKL